ncbi:MAG: MG2 domain-containing protein [Bacteroidota bacterium]|nr:MG2 domain-containing protein [Bacteroidota bacterium]
MKTYIKWMTAIALVVAGTVLFAHTFMRKNKNLNPDEAGHALTALWKNYDAAVRADRPAKRIAVLDEIKREARAKKLHWDFYDAATRYVQDAAQRNWKLRDSLETKLSEEIADYAEPVVTYVYGRGRGQGAWRDFILSSRKRLEAGRNAAFYENSSVRGYLKGLLPGFFKDDFEFVLWNELSFGNDWVVPVLEETLGGRYPDAPYLEFRLLLNKYGWGYGMSASDGSRKEEREKAFQAYAAKYAGKAVSLLARELLLTDRMRELGEKGSSKDYQDLFAACEWVEKERSRYSGDPEGKIAKNCAEAFILMTTLQRKDIYVSCSEDTAIIRLRNLNQANLVLKRVSDDKVFLRTTVENPTRSFYALDEMKVPLPKVDDGDYTLVATNGKISGNCAYRPHTLSIAVRSDREGQKFYVAGFRTGKPVERVDLELFRSGKSVAKVNDVAVDGFTPLPDEIAKTLRDNVWAGLVVSARDADGLLRMTPEHWIGNPGTYPEVPETSQVFGELFADRTAYNPGETVQFKAVLFQGDRRRALHVLDPGEPVTVTLYNSESKRVDSRELKTNAFGSVAGNFVLPKTERNGRFRMQVEHDRKTVTSLSLTVDEFILPTYDLQFGDLDSLYFPGDSVEVRGCVSSYSGHPLTAAKVTYTVDSWGDRIDEGAVDLTEDGSFLIRFGSDRDRHAYEVKVKITDRTGETREFIRRVYILDRINLFISLLNKSEGTLQLKPNPGSHPRPHYALPEILQDSDPYAIASILSGDTATIRFEARNSEGKAVPAEIDYVILAASGEELYKGSVPSGTQQDFVLKESGLYQVSCTVRMESKRGDPIENRRKMEILRLSDSDKVLTSPIENVFKVLGTAGPLKTGEAFGIQFGAGRGDVWALVELFGDRRQPLKRKALHLSGEAGREGSLARIEYAYQADWPDAVLLKVFYFKDETSYQYSREFRRERPSLDLPLAFETFEDRTLPATEYSLTLKTLPGVEAVASVFDKSTETISPNRWSTVRLNEVWCRDVTIGATTGSVSSDSDMFLEMVVTGYGTARRSESKVVSRAVMDQEAVMPGVALSAEAVEEVAADDNAGLAEVTVRSDFSASLAFEPFLRSGPDGRMTLKFKTSDKLSTYFVQLFAHDPSLRNAVLRKEMVVSLPVKVAVVEPKYLYQGDRYVLHATVSSSSAEPVSGTLGLLVLGKGGETIQTMAKQVTVPAGGVLPASFEVPVGTDSLRCKVVFADDAKTFSDGVLLALPVYEARQTLTEAHSAVFLAGMDKDSLLREISARFTGTTAFGAVTREIDIRRMLQDAVPSKITPDGVDVLSLSEALYARNLAARLLPDSAAVLSEGTMPDSELSAKIAACQNADGGFGWFEGMKSSPVITAALLERHFKMQDAPVPLFPADRAAEAVKYLDRQQFVHDRDWPYWSGVLSMTQYVYVRSMFASVPFDVDRTNRDERSAYAENFKEFKEYLKDYLLPKAKDGRGLSGRILDKSRRIRTLLQLLNHPGGIRLASDWGIRFSASARMNRSTRADLQSLLEYAVTHRDGGWYYPNAVMPWRGLLESELYAHSLLCDLLSDPKTLAILSEEETDAALRIADGIRIWIMLQKETQHWDTDPAYLEAIHSVMSGSEAALATSVITMSKTYEKPFEEIVAAGNGFTIERRFFKEVKGAAEINLLEVRPGDLLRVGDKLVAEYRIWNQENRSFVKLTAPREAGFRPMDQLSGYYGWWLRPLSVRGSYSVTPQGYRNVKTDRTEYFFDVYPEEKTTVTETFFVTQEGVFRAPVVMIESLYAPHYRANGAFGGNFTFNPMIP